MARKYVNPAKSAPVDDQVLTEARIKAEAAAARLREAERGDPLAPGWDAEFESATTAVRATARRVEAIEALRAAQLERGGQRAAAVKSAEKDLAGMATALTASRDQVAAAAEGHLRQLAALAVAAEAHNGLLAQSRARLAELGLRVRDDLVDEGQEHDEGVLDGPGLRAEGVDWTPVVTPGLVVHALLQVFGVFRGPFSGLRHSFAPYLVESRPDGLRVPAVADAGVTLPSVPAPVVARRASLSDVVPAGDPADGDVSGFERAPRRGRTA